MMKPPKRQCNAEVHKWDEDDGEEGDGVDGDGAGVGKIIFCGFLELMVSRRDMDGENTFLKKSTKNNSFALHCVRRIIFVDFFLFLCCFSMIPRFFISINKK